MTKTWCVGGRQNSKSINRSVYENLHTKTQKLVKIIKGRRDFCDQKKSQVFTK